MSFKHGLDPDVTVYPITSTVADIIVTACYIGLLNVFSLNEFGRYLTGLLGITFLFIVSYVSAKNRKEPEFTKTIKEFFSL